MVIKPELVHIKHFVKRYGVGSDKTTGQQIGKILTTWKLAFLHRFDTQ